MTDRIVPHDSQAEESTLGAMLLSYEAIEGAVGIVEAADFYKPAHGAVFAAVVEMYELGVAIDSVTVADLLRQRGQLEGIGGPQALATIMASTPATTNVRRYAEIVARHAHSRRIIGVLAESAASAYELTDPGEVSERTLVALEALGTPGTSLPNDVSSMDEWLEAEHTAPPWAIPGIIRVGWRIIIVAAEGSGKALSLTEPIWTFDGWSTMGELRPGQQVLNAKCMPTTIEWVSPVYVGRPCYRVTLGDGSSVVADEDHLWRTADSEGRQCHPWKQKTLTTAKIRDSMELGHVVVNAVLGPRPIVSVEPVPSVPVRCISVDDPDHMFLVGRGGIPTHNSVATRQIALSAAQGVHPFHHRDIPAVNTLLIDLENPDEAIRETGDRITKQLRVRRGEHYREHGCWIWHRPAGIDLRSRKDRSEMEAVLAHVQPKLVCLGPLYRSFTRRGREDHEEVAEQVQRALDQMRNRHQFGIVIEHHAPKATLGKRDLVPFGSSLWQRWPDLGLTLESDPDVVGALRLGSYRGNRVRANWPTRLDRGQLYPWSGFWESGIDPPDEPRVRDAGPGF